MRRCKHDDGDEMCEKEKCDSLSSLHFLPNWEENCFRFFKYGIQLLCCFCLILERKGDKSSIVQMQLDMFN